MAFSFTQGEKSRFASVFSHNKYKSIGFIQDACKEGSLATIIWFSENVPSLFSDFKDYLTSDAAASGSLEIIEWLCKNGSSINRRSANIAASFGQLEVLQWFVEHGCPLDEWLMDNAMGGGHLHIIEWLFATGHYCFRKHQLGMVRSYGYKEVEEWMKEVVVSDSD